MNQQPATTVAFLGLGVMGLPMARNLVVAGFDVRAFDVSAASRAAAEQAGLPVVADTSTAVADASFVVTMLPDTGDVQRCLLGAAGVQSMVKPGTAVVDMSTISPGATRDIAGELAASGIAFLDAPVSGGVVGARAGSLSVMVGGSTEDFERTLPVLSAMGTQVTHMGSVGAGQATKLCNQLAVAINLQAVCEALMLGQALGVEPEPLRVALSGGAADSWMLRNLAPQMIVGDDSAGFRIALQAKDLRLAGEAAEQTHTPLPGLASVTTLYREALAHGEAANGNQALFRVYERLCNRPLAGPAAAEAS